jgi:hypothetical protein
MAALRQPDSLPFPGGAPGTVDLGMPFDHIVVVMMENHSFDNLLGELSRQGQPGADGLTFNQAGVPTNSNPGAGTAVCLFAGGDFHGRQPLVLLGSLPDLPESALPDGRDSLWRCRQLCRSAPQWHDLRPLTPLRDQLAQLLYGRPADGDHPVDHQEVPGELVPDRPVLR